MGEVGINVDSNTPSHTFDFTLIVVLTFVAKACIRSNTLNLEFSYIIFHCFYSIIFDFSYFIF